MSASIISFTNHRVPSSRAVTPADEGCFSSRLSSAPLSPLECDALTRVGSSTIYQPSSSMVTPVRRKVGRSPHDRLNHRDKDGLALFSYWTAPKDHWWRA
jgi:hypothetical protein